MAAPTFDAASSTSTIATGVLTWAHTVGATANVLVIAVALRNVFTVSSVTFNGSSAGVAQIAQTHPGEGLAGAELWRVIAPATGTHNVVVTISDSGEDQVCAGAVSLIGANQTTPVTASATNNGAASTSLTVNVASNTGELVVGMGCNRADYSYTSTGTGQTERVDLLNFNSMTMATQTGATTTTHSYTASGASPWCAIAASFQGGGATFSLPLDGTSYGVTGADATVFPQQIQTWLRVGR